ncbi:MAG: PASTA domain-containing protein [Clostridia bacterium]|nr:PASTA domain-containing protein [Clostridia bacterium]
MAITTPKSSLRKRISYVYVMFLLLFCILGLWIAKINIIDGEKLRTGAIEQQTRDYQVSSPRGTIYDRNGKALAISSSAETISVSPAQIAEKVKKNKYNVDDIATKLAEILELDVEELKKKLTKKNSDGIYLADVEIASKVEPEIADEVRALNLTGVYFKEDTKRYYPLGTFASHVIGYVGKDNQGLGGIEMVYDSELSGVPGRVVTLKNAQGTDMPFQEERHIDSEKGLNVVLTLDETIQHFAEKHLEDAYRESQARQGAACIVMDVKTGEILAMATQPNYDLNNPNQITDKSVLEYLETLETDDEYNKAVAAARNKMWRNKAVVDSYEPGSCFKIMTMSMAFEEGVVTPEDHFFCPGYKLVEDRKIKCAETSGHGAQTFRDGVKNSCNPVFIEVGQRVGIDAFKKYFKAFGFRDKTGFDLPGEASGVFYTDEQFNVVELATASFGQGPKITPLQLITAVSAVANGGNLMKPHLVKQFTNEQGTVIKKVQPTVVRQIVSKETSEIVCELLENAVTNGSGQNAYIKGYRVAGKTGTSEKLPRGSGKYTASFVGFAPANDPKVACLVVIDEPVGGYYGGQIAAPAVGRILEDTLKYLGVEPQYTEKEKTTIDVDVPDVTELELAVAKKRLNDLGLKYTIIGGGEKVVRQIPLENATVNSGSVVVLYTENVENQMVTVPDVKGKTLTRVKSTLTSAGLNLSIVGAGATGSTSESTIAESQTPQAGEQVPQGTVIKVEFRFQDVEGSAN